jgi:hypothetical protein
MNLSLEQTTGRILGLSTQAFDFYFPPLGGRVLYAMDFPAYEISDELQRFDLLRSAPDLRFTIEDKQRQLPVRYILGIRELTFFAGVFLLWFWVGFEADKFQETRQLGGQSPVRAWQSVKLLLILALGVLLITRSVMCLSKANCGPPERVIVTLGLIWPALFFALFYFKLKHEIGRRRSPSTPGVA